MLYVSIAFFLTLTPFLVFFGIGDGIRTPKEIASIIGFISIIAIGLNYEKKAFNSKFLIIFWAWCFLTTVFNTYTIPTFLPNVVLNMPAEIFAWKELYYITLAIFVIYFISSAKSLSTFRQYNLSHLRFILKPSSYEYEIKSIANVINWVVIVMCLYALIQALGLDQFFRATATGQVFAPGTSNVALTPTDPRFSFTHRVVGTIGNPSLLAVWLAICLPFTIYLRKLRGYVGFVLGLTILIMVQSSTAVIAFLTSFIFYFAFKYKFKFLRIFIPLLFILGATGIFYTGVHKPKYYKDGYFNPTGRIEIHKETWKILQHRPLIGLGLGTFEYLIGLNPEVVERVGDENWRSLHDEYGQIWFSTGLIGLGFFLIFIMRTFVKFLKNITNETIVLASSLVAFLVVSLTLFPMRLPPHSFYGVVFVGLLLRGLK